MQLIVYSHLRWNFVYQRPQHLLSRLALRYPVWFVEEPTFDDGVPRIEASTPCAGVTVLKPCTSVRASGFHDDQLAVLRPLLAAFFQQAQIKQHVAWFYTPMALPLIADSQPDAVVFDCMDELSAFKDAPRQLRQRETALMKRADLVLTGGPSLYEAKRNLHPNVLCLPSAVDAAHFAPAHSPLRLERVEQAQRLQAGIGTPRLGFFGVIDERFDLPLLTTLVDARPTWQFVMVGPVVKIDPATLPQRPNLAWLGQQSYDMLPALVATWDVCLVLFALNDATRFISPTKTLEYLAAEKPVVSTAVRDVVELYGDVVRVGADAESFVAACEAALAETAPERATRIERANARVALYSWDKTADQIAVAIDQALQTVRAAHAAAPLPRVSSNSAHLAPSTSTLAIPQRT